ncbi:hypothetical protein TKK_0018567 [Trichogramma kaykai]
MFTSYYHQFRALKRKKCSSTNSSLCSEESKEVVACNKFTEPCVFEPPLQHELPEEILDNQHENIEAHDDPVESSESAGSTTTFDSSSSSQTSSLNEEDESSKSNNEMHLENYSENSTLKEKLQMWAMNNIFTLRNSVISELLHLLHDQVKEKLPLRAETLLKTKKCSNTVIIVPTAKGNNGLYTYFGIEKILLLMLENSEYDDGKIELLVNIDGMSPYKNSSKQFWPILIRVLHQEFTCTPAAVALYCGDSKPKFMEDLLDDFVNEAAHLITNGLKTPTKNYIFNVKGFSCDTPARAAIKYVKGHGGFYACERCDTKGRSVDKRRIYDIVGKNERSKDSFLNKSQPEHHKPDVTSPLVRIPGFDPVRQVFLEPMHMFHLGVMKSIFEKFVDGNKRTKLNSRQKKHLEQILSEIEPGMTQEFQRKKFNLKDYVHWKATQYGFLLCYTLSMLFERFISTAMYKFLLLLFIACRILFNEQLALTYADFADSLLKGFFKIMPTMFGKSSQVMNFHNLNHVAADVKYVGLPLSSFSAYAFENCLGQISKLIRTPNNPLSQVTRRLFEMQQLGKKFIDKRCSLTDKAKMSLKENSKFAVVDFKNWENPNGLKSTELVPVSWLSYEDSGWFCVYPDEKDYPKLDKWIREEKKPGAKWGRYEVDALKEAKNHEKGVKRLRKSFETADITSTDNDEDGAQNIAVDPPQIIIDESSLAGFFAGLEADANSGVPEFKKNTSRESSSCEPSSSKRMRLDPEIFATKKDIEEIEKGIKKNIKKMQESILYDIKEFIKLQTLNAPQLLDLPAMPFDDLVPFVQFEDELKNNPAKRDALTMRLQRIANGETDYKIALKKCLEL